MFFSERNIRAIHSEDAGTLIDEQRKSKTITTSVRYNRHAHTVKATFKCPLDKKFIGNPTLFIIALKKLIYLH